MESDLHGISFTAVEKDAKFETRYVKEVPFVNGRYTKGAPFLPKMVYKRVRVAPLAGASQYKTFLRTPPFLGFSLFDMDPFDIAGKSS